jgi:histidyl-tRNA synthetase
MTKPPKLQPVRGTHDCLGADARLRQHIVTTATDVVQRYGYSEIHTPIFEFTEVFARTLGETSDIVAKEMYSFEDRGGESLTLRPEFTAGIARALISGGLQQHLPLKLYASGPLFRYERPQKGRMRQFHQFDVECLGILDAGFDGEMIAMGWHVLQALGIADAVKVEVNSLGDRDSRMTYREALVAYLSRYAGDLSEDSQKRLSKNPLRILDSKDAGDRAIITDAPLMQDSFNAESHHYFEKLQDTLALLGIPVTLNPKLVRGMDYYSHAVFEFTTTQLGAQGTVLGGGRYDGLIGMMGGPETPAIGWAAGIERLEMMVAKTLEAPRPLAVVPKDSAHMAAAITLAQWLRGQGVVTHLDYSGDTKKRFARANKLGAHGVVVVDGERLELKNMDSGEQKVVVREQLLGF